MRTTTSFFFYSTFILLLSTFTAAWPWPKFLPEIDALIVRRQDDSSSTAPETKVTSTPAPTTVSGSKSTGSMSITAAPEETSSNTMKASGSGSNSNSGSTKATTAKHISYDPRLPPGGISIISPPATAGMPLIKVGDNATFVFNYTSVSQTPTALNIMATCTANNEMYTIAMNQTVSANETGQFVWDTDGYATSTAPLLVETYTLFMYDSDGSPTDIPQAGYMAPFTTYEFGMYTREPYTDDGGSIKCVTCSGALSSTERSALGFLLGMSLITVLSFTWFVNGLNVIW